MNICQCGLIKQSKAGVSVVDGVEICNNCQLPTTIAGAVTLAASAPATHTPPVDTPEWRRWRNEVAVNALRGNSGKFAKALNGEGLVSVSVMGTDSWAEFVSLSVQAMQLETLTDIARTLEALHARVAALEEALERRQD